MSLAFVDPLSQLLLQLVTVLIAARLTGLLFARLGQSAVIGEIAAGILLGPSLLGWLAPGVFQTLFPASSLGTLQLLSQIGVCLFLFVVGMTVDVGHLRQKAPAALVVRHASIVVPALCGALLSPWLFPTLRGPDATLTSFTVFMAISMSITAFPVLARILDERGLWATPLGAMALTCAAVGDVTAWTMLAGIVAVTQEGAWTGSIVTLVRVAIFAIVMLLGVRRLLPRLMGSSVLPDAALGPYVLVGALALMLAGALTHRPRLEILDEPTAGVDIELRDELWEYIRRLHALGTSILLTTHYLEEAETLCEQVAFIRSGQIVDEGTPSGLRERYDATSLEDVDRQVMNT